MQPGELFGEPEQLIDVCQCGFELSSSEKNKFCHLASFSAFIQLDIFLIYFDFLSEIV